MEIVVAFLVGVVSSGAVAYFVYRRQRRESLQSEAILLRRLAEHGESLDLATSTALVVADSTARLERDVSVLRRQLTSALDGAETIREEQIAAAKNLLPTDGLLDERFLKDLHRLLLGGEFDYAGQLRDMPVQAGGPAVESAVAIPVVAPAEIRHRLTGVLDAWNTALGDTGATSHDEWLARIAALHAGLLVVHPFFDGNGLVARVLLALQTEKYVNSRVVLPRRDRVYFVCLREASGGDISDLVEYLKKRSQ